MGVRMTKTWRLTIEYLDQINAIDSLVGRIMVFEGSAMWIADVSPA
jgi:hypothetical protein